MAFNNLSYSKDWSEENKASSRYFATHESDETQVRADMQLLYNEILAWANEMVTKLTDCSNIGMGEASTLAATNVKDALIELKNTIVAGTVPDYSLTNAQMSRKSVEGVAAIVRDNIANNAISATELSDDAVTTGKIADGAIEHSHLASYNEDTAQNAPVGTTNIQTGAITNSKIANYTISHNKLATVSNPDGAAVDVNNIAYKTITRDRISGSLGTTLTVTSSAGKALLVPDTFISKVSSATGTYTFTYNGSAWLLGGSAVTLAQYGLSTIGTFASGDTLVVVVANTTPAIGTDQIENGTVTNAKLAGSISNDKLAGGITADKISTVSPNSLNAYVPIGKGGTNAGDAATARTNLGVSASGVVNVGGNNYTLRTGSSGAAGYITFVT